MTTYVVQGKSHLGTDSDDKDKNKNKPPPPPPRDGKKKDDNPGCKSSGQCSVATGTVILGVIIWYVNRWSALCRGLVY